MKDYRADEAVREDTVHRVRFTFQRGEYRACYESTIASNCLGFDNIAEAFSNLLEYDLPKDDEGDACLVLRDGAGDERVVRVSAFDEDDLREWVVAGEIVGVEPKPGAG